MNLLTVFIFVLIIVLIYAVYKLLTKTTTTLSGFSDARKALVVTGQKSSANYGYSVWIYVDAWKNTAAAPSTGKLPAIHKNILTRTTASNPTFILYLDNATNDLHLRMTLSTTTVSYQTCTVQNIKLQKWVNITMSIYGNTVDLYLDGKLVKTCVLTTMPVATVDNDIIYVGGKIDSAAAYVGPATDDGNLVGYISNVLYKKDYFTPEDAWDIYSAGYGGAGMFDFANRYKLNFSITKENQTVGQISL